MGAIVPDCFLNVYKPQGITAHDCIQQLRQILHIKRIGHSGTLDPMAVGVLPVAVGKYTRLLNFLSGGKVYRAEIQFGIGTDTDDITGQILQRTPVPHLTLGQVLPLIPQFVGTISQRPPQYSAIHYQGQRLYDLARKGVISKAMIPIRSIEVEAIQVLAWESGEFPRLWLEIRCGTGTYIRSIARDLGELVGCGGCLSALQRTASNGFTIEHSLTLPTIQAHWQTGQLPHPAPEQVLSHMPAVLLNETELHRWKMGQALLHDHGYPPDTPIATYDLGHTLQGISLSKKTPQHHGLLTPKVVL
jgi:tRNA pseudouridine55 synthase